MDGDGTSGARTQARMMAFMGVELKPAILKATLRSIAKDEKCEKARPQNSGVNRIPAKSLNVNAVGPSRPYLLKSCVGDRPRRSSPALSLSSPLPLS